MAFKKKIKGPVFCSDVSEVRLAECRCDICRIERKRTLMIVGKNTLRTFCRICAPCLRCDCFAHGATAS